MSNTPIYGLIVTGLLAVLGTVAGGVVNGYWEKEVSQTKFQSDLILDALDSDETAQRAKSLKFLVDANLITDPDIRAGVGGILAQPAVKKILDEEGGGIPQFTVRRLSTSSSGDSAARGVVEKFPTLDGRSVALIGFDVRHGDIVDAVAPIYAAVSPRLELDGQYVGKSVGGDGGGDTRLLEPGRVVTRVEIQRGTYFGGQRVLRFRATWSRLSAEGVDSGDTVTSPWLGTGQYAKDVQPIVEYAAGDDAFISDFQATAGHHTNGDVFLRTFEVVETMVLRPG